MLIISRLGSDNEDADEEFETRAKDDWNVSDLVRDSAEDLSDDSCYPALSKATLIDQDSGEVYQVIRYNPPLRFVLFLEPFSYKKCWRNETITVVFSSSLKTSEEPEDRGRPS